MYKLLKMHAIIFPLFGIPTLSKSQGPTPTPGSTVTVQCTGYGKGCDLSSKFWSTRDPGQKVGLVVENGRSW